MADSAISICIIGAGAAGLVALKTLQDTQEIQNGTWRMVAYEARDKIGGVWYPSPPVGSPPASPMYEGLTTNLPHPVMALSSFWFRPGTSLFPPASVVLEYLRDYAAHFGLETYIQTNVKVEEAVWDGESWNVRLSDGRVQRFDKLIVANGHYGSPRYPDIPGLQSWIDTNRASHSVYYRNELPYRGKVVLVIGNGPSGQDITHQVANVASLVYHSITGGTPDKRGNVQCRGRVVELKEDGTAIFDDGGVTSEAIDHVILATGYMTSFPFLTQLRSGRLPVVPPIPRYLSNTSYGVFPLARHLLPVQDDIPPSAIAFIGLPIRVVPFPLFEAQCLYVIKIYRDNAAFDEKEECRNVIEQYNLMLEQAGSRNNLEYVAKAWHVLDDERQFIYRKQLLDSAGASPETYPEEWALRIYRSKNFLRTAWKHLEDRGEADKWVKDVGKGGRDEWVRMIDRLLATIENYTSNLHEGY